MDPQGIAYSGQPVPEVFRAVDPPRAVLVDRAALFPREPHEAGYYSPFGLQMHGIVEGKLTCWGLCEQGHWWGLVTYPIAFGAEAKSVTHWVPAWVLKPTQRHRQTRAGGLPTTGSLYAPQREHRHADS